MRMHSWWLAPALAVAACGGASGFSGLAPALPSGGPTVRASINSGETPFPWDLLARLEPADGQLHPNLVPGPGAGLGAGLVQAFDRLGGFGTTGPISIAFDQDLDAVALWNRHNQQGVPADPADPAKAIYLIGLDDGMLYPLDVGSGRFPVSIVGAAAPSGLFANDPLAGAGNLLFATCATPACNGPADAGAPNTLHPFDPAYPASHGGLSQLDLDLATFYERSSRTLIVRPLLPLPGGHRFAVVLTRRLVGSNGKPVSSPFSGINHAAETQSLSALPGLLPAGTALSDVAFTWSFTTQDPLAETVALANGVRGAGKFAALSPPLVQGQGDGSVQLLMVVRRGLDAGDTPYRVPASQLLLALKDPGLSGFLPRLSPAAGSQLAAQFQQVDSVINGELHATDLLEPTAGSPASPTSRAGASTFSITPAGDDAQATDKRIPFMLIIPRKQPALGRVEPFPVAVVQHGEGSNRVEAALLYGGAMARFGVATLAIDVWGHGPAASASDAAKFRAVFANYGLGAFGDAVLSGRQRDLNGDGTAESGADLWSPQLDHTRDVIRQTALDELEALRVLRAFNGNFSMLIPTGTGSGYALAGDFDQDGIPDVGGPTRWPATLVSTVDKTFVLNAGDPNPGSDTFLIGESVGAASASIVAAVESSVKAAALIAPQADLADVPLRTASTQIRREALLPVAGLTLVACAFDPATGCSSGAPSALAFATVEEGAEHDVGIAPLSLSAGDRVVACNLSRVQPAPAQDPSGIPLPAASCSGGTVRSDGSFDLALAAEGPDWLIPPGTGGTVQRQRPGDALAIFVQHAGAVSRIDQYGFAGTSGALTIAVGDPLTAPASGLGAGRNTPALRKLLPIWQALADPADPVNWAALWSSGSRRGGLSLHELVIAPVGDPLAPTAGALDLARAAGLLPTRTVDPAFGLTLDQLLVTSGATEGAARLGLYATSAAGPRSTLGSHVSCGGGGCSGTAVLDLADYSCAPDGSGCLDGFAAPRLSPALRSELLRPDLDAAGNPLGLSALLLPDLGPSGGHALAVPDPGRAFDPSQFLLIGLGRYFESRGKELHLEPCQASTPPSCPWAQ